MAERVIDASIAIKWVVKGEPFRGKARQLLHDTLLKGITLIGPPLLEAVSSGQLTKPFMRL